MRARRLVYFEDEAPSIGSGWRLIEAQIGYKWVYVKELNAKRRSKLKRKTWDQIARREYEAKKATA